MTIIQKLSFQIYSGISDVKSKSMRFVAETPALAGVTVKLNIVSGEIKIY